ncbi:hypothetical protein [Chishuiella sp.]|uniref:hypothetical protein n=1 Tax=Chishuiella sp. TaxID=1969467 RepID=UPI0028AF8C44|nr:hypothetical protein [Chishuiella sp.]
MKFYFYISILFLSFLLKAQEIDPDQIRLNIYKVIVDDIKTNNNSKINKEILIDPMINKFENFEINEFGIKLDMVKYDDNLDFCEKTNFYKCAPKLDIDKYKLVDVYKNGQNEIFPDFYGIYSPIDSWYNLIYYSAVKHFEKDSHFKFYIVLPVKNIFMEKGTSKTKMSFYTFTLDDNFIILKFDKVTSDL